MAVHSFDDLKHHIGHKIVVVAYGRMETSEDGTSSFHTHNTSCECETCNEVIISFDEGENDYDE